MYRTGLDRFKCKKTGHGLVSVLRIVVFDVDRFRPVFFGPVRFFDDPGTSRNRFGSGLAKKG